MDYQKENHDDRRRIKYSSASKAHGFKDTKSESIDEEMEAGEIKNESASKIKRHNRSPSRSASPISRSKSRSRNRRGHGQANRYSEESSFAKRRSPSGEKYPVRLEGQKIEVKLLLPRKLANDQRELRYIEQISKCSIRSGDELQSGESMIYVRGSLRENNECIKLLMKRLCKYEKK